MIDVLTEHPRPLNRFHHNFYRFLQSLTSTMYIEPKFRANPRSMTFSTLATPLQSDSFAKIKHLEHEYAN